MNQDKIRIIHVGPSDNNILEAETHYVQIPRTAIFICTRGKGRLILNGASYDIEERSLIVYFPHGIMHIQERTPDVEGIIISCDLETIQPLLYKVSDFNGLFLIRQHPVTTVTKEQAHLLVSYIGMISHTMNKLADEEKYKHERRNKPIREICTQQIELLGNSLMLEIVSCYTHFAPAPSSLSRKDNVLQKFITMLYQSYKLEHEVKFYSEAQFLTSRYFSAIIKEKSGKTPSEWIAAALLVEAKRQLSTTSHTIKEVSENLHFPNQSYFGKWFKNLTGLSPLEFKAGKESPLNKNGDEMMSLDIDQLRLLANI